MPAIGEGCRDHSAGRGGNWIQVGYPLGSNGGCLSETGGVSFMSKGGISISIGVVTREAIGRA